MPDFITLLSSHNAKHGIRLTFSELKKTARRIERTYNERPEEQRKLTKDEYFRLDHADPTADEAVACVDGDDPCHHAHEHHPNHAKAARRVAGKAAA